MSTSIGSGLSRLQRRLLREEAEAAILDAILEGKFAPGQTLDDRELQSWLGISRTPVREALHALQVKGLIEIAPQSRTRVAPASPETIHETIQTLGVVLTGVFRVTFPAIPPDEIGDVITLVDRCVAATQSNDAREHLSASIAFYNTLLQYCPNATLRHFVTSSLVSLSYQYRASLGLWKADWERLDAAWRLLRSALETNDSVKGEDAIAWMHRLRRE